MKDDELAAPGQTYRIGAVSRLTGVPADTLRVWERRYDVVVPMRTASGTRLYGPEDVGRLSLIKQLVDRGDAISSVAGLSMEQLRERLRGSGLAPARDVADRPCRVVALGPTLPERLRGASGGLAGIDLVGSFTDRDGFLSRSASLNPDVAVIEMPTIHLDQVPELAELVDRSGAARAVVVYGFATAATLGRLDARRIVPRRAPADPADLRRWCLMAHASMLEAFRGPDDETGIDLSRPIPPRRFDDAALMRVAQTSPTVRCECPHHLADLIASLGAFERYSEECEIRHLEDAALHGFLHAATAQARAVMEAALARLLDAEGIDLDAGVSAGAPLDSDDERLGA